MTDKESRPYIYKMDRCRDCLHCTSFQRGFVSQATYVICKKLPGNAYMALVPTDLDKGCSLFILKEEGKMEPFEFRDVVLFNTLKARVDGLVGRAVKIRGTSEKITVLFDKRSMTSRITNDLYFICVTENGQSIDVRATDIEGFWMPRVIEKAQGLFCKKRDPHSHVLLPRLFTRAEAETYAKKKDMSLLMWPAPNCEVIKFNAQGLVLTT